jgi:hypothetical protein
MQNNWKPISPDSTPIGGGATMCLGSDRRAATIISVTLFRTGLKAGLVKSVVAQEDQSIILNKDGIYGQQAYDYCPDRLGPTREFFAKRDGRLHGKGNWGVLALGHRETYTNPSF